VAKRYVAADAARRTEYDTEEKLKMTQLSSSNKPEDIATLAYIWAIPLVVMEENANYFTNPNTPPGLGVGPWNTMIPNRELANGLTTHTEVPLHMLVHVQRDLI
jgi:hypothetical protein